MADDDIKPDADESAAEGETVAAETTAEGDQGGGEAPPQQPEAAAAEQPVDEAQATAEADAVADDTAEVSDLEAADSNLNDSNDGGADEPDAVAAESLDTAGYTEVD